ncbi:hypothetical protein prwr041_17260 [Prevotella herbatica]|uniref:Uncharacterized protein n=1 Tax=Prevotella herbatica TaxID=2801997 RepID=A0ABM7NZ72_9BACT|nr:hypothetical protein prwr041_17260 [Prevotella herbatica]
MLNDVPAIGIARELFIVVEESVLFHSGTDTEKFICLLSSKTFISLAHEENEDIIINNKSDTFIPRKNFLTITQSFLFSPREKRKVRFKNI